MTLTVILRNHPVPSEIDSEIIDNEVLAGAGGNPVALLTLATVDTGILDTNIIPVSLTVEGFEVAVTGVQGTRHGGGPHRNGLYSGIGTAKLSVSGSPVVLSGDLATCGHLVVALPSKLSVASTVA